MEHEKFFKDDFESSPDYRKIVSTMFLFRNDVDLWTECGFLKTDMNGVCVDVKKVLIELKKTTLIKIKTKKKPSLKELLIIKWKTFLQRCLKILDTNALWFFLLTIISQVVLKQSKLTDHEIK